MPRVTPTQMYFLYQKIYNQNKYYIYYRFPFLLRLLTQGK